MGGSRNYGSDDNVILHKVGKGFEPTRVVVREGLPLEKGSVEHVGIVKSKCYHLDKRLNCLAVGVTLPGFAVPMTYALYTSLASVKGLVNGHRSNQSILLGYQSLVSG